MTSEFSPAVGRAQEVLGDLSADHSYSDDSYGGYSGSLGDVGPEPSGDLGFPITDVDEAPVLTPTAGTVAEPTLGAG
ncbi:MAG TPA: hypothetical protein VHW44_13325 [Pseudonocardiaceae bacterium]|nr:hypothetical protein [Pseudonocardiaceae bacterium]